MTTVSRSRGGFTFTVLAVAIYGAALAGSAQSTAPSQERAEAPTATAAPPVAAKPPTPVLSDEEMERFLKQAKITKTKGTGKGVTDSTRATMSDGTITHDAHIQTLMSTSASSARHSASNWISATAGPTTSPGTSSIG